jgi:hypothetical protein
LLAGKTGAPPSSQVRNCLLALAFFTCAVCVNAQGAQGAQGGQSAQSAQGFAPRLAIVEFTTDAQETNQKEDIAAMRDMVNTDMSSLGKFNVMPNSEVNEFLIFNRIEIENVYKEEYYALFADENIAFLLSADVRALKKGYRISYFFISTKERLIYKSKVYNMKNTGADIRKIIEKSVIEFFNTIPLTSDDLANAYEAPKYSVGDKGPAGGIIFFVKANYADGWRYLEAAPGDLNYKLPWGIWNGSNYLPDSPGTSEELGSGKHNTELLAISEPEAYMPVPTASQACTNLVFNGFDDWFLPSKEELNLMYRALARDAVFAFHGGAYWSSSQTTTGAAWFQTFDNGRLYPNGLITEAYLVRAIRSF